MPAAKTRGVRGETAFSTAAPTSTQPAVLVNANSQRLAATFWNNGSQTVYLGRDGGVTSSNGMPLLASSGWTDDQSQSPWWAIAASGTADIRIVEVSK